MFKRVLLALTALAAVLAVLPGSTAEAATSTRIGPGTQMVTAGSQCTANFVFRDARGRLLVGYAAHCAGLGEASDTDGCTTRSRPLGTRVRFVSGATPTSEGRTIGWGTLRYSSWIAMQRAGTQNRSWCRYNDFALVQVDRAQRSRVDPTVPFWGGPTALGAVPDAGARTFTFGSSSLRAGQLSPKAGTVRSANTRWATVLTLTPGVPGDSGSGFLDGRGRAVGVLSTLNVLPDTGTNGVGGLYHQVRYARTHGVPLLRLVPGREAFTQAATF